MIGYVTLGTNDFEKATKFYDELFASLGISRVTEIDGFLLWGKSFDDASIAIAKPYDGKAATVGNGTMVAIRVDSQDAVHALHQKVLDLGGTDEGAPGPRGEGFYAGYFRDLDGNKLNAFCLG